MTTDTYKTISKPSTSLYTEKGSKFYGFAYPVTSEEDCKEKLELLAREHPKSRHVCYAYRLGEDDIIDRSSDDGEPSGTAGMPILGQLKKHDLTNCLIAVVRYFGGTLLGTGGLIKAYRAAAVEAIENAKIITVERHGTITIRGDYQHYPHVETAIASLDLSVVERILDDHFLIKLEVPINSVDELAIKLISAATSKFPLEIDLDRQDWGFELIREK